MTQLHALKLLLILVRYQCIEWLVLIHLKHILRPYLDLFFSVIYKLFFFCQSLQYFLPGCEWKRENRECDNENFGCVIFFSSHKTSTSFGREMLWFLCSNSCWCLTLLGQSRKKGLTPRPAFPGTRFLKLFMFADVGAAYKTNKTHRKPQDHHHLLCCFRWIHRDCRNIHWKHVFFLQHCVKHCVAVNLPYSSAEVVS